LKMSVEERMIRIISEVLGVEPEKITMDSNFVEDFGVESIDTIEMVAAAEEEFDLDVPLEDAEKNTTVGKTIEYVKMRLAEREG
jgi:acyl carrier protein